MAWLRPGPRFLQAAVVSAMLAILYQRVLRDLAVDWWTEPSLSHSLLIPPLALYIAWIYRRETFRDPARPTAAGLWLTGGACLMFGVGVVAGEFFLCRMSFVLQIAGLIWTFWGTERFKRLMFPLLFLATAVPLPALLYQRLTAPLQIFASSEATAIARALGVTVSRDGNILQLANVSLSVSEACSGLNSLSALMTTSLLLGFISTGRTGPRVLLFALAVPLAIGTNILRLAGTAVIADYHLELALGFYHMFSGWLVFVVSFAILYSISRAVARVYGS